MKAAVRVHAKGLEPLRARSHTLYWQCIHTARKPRNL